MSHYFGPLGPTDISKVTCYLSMTESDLDNEHKLTGPSFTKATSCRILVVIAGWREGAV